MQVWKGAVALGIKVVVLVFLGLPELLGQAHPATLDAVTRVKERHEARLLNIPGVVGVGVGLSDKVLSEPVIEIYVKKATEQVRQTLPASLEGVGVKIVESGEIRAY